MQKIKEKLLVPLTAEQSLTGKQAGDLTRLSGESQRVIDRKIL